MQSLTLGDLQIDAVERPGEVLELHWTGSSNSRDPAPPLRTYFDLAMAAATARGLRLTMHFERLQFFNSSTVVVLLAFVRDASRRGLHVTFCYDPALRWQAHNFVALEQLQADNPGFHVITVGDGRPLENIGDP